MVSDHPIGQHSFATLKHPSRKWIQSYRAFTGHYWYDRTMCFSQNDWGWSEHWVLVLTLIFTCLTLGKLLSGPVHFPCLSWGSTGSQGHIKYDWSLSPICFSTTAIPTPQAWGWGLQHRWPVVEFSKRSNTSGRLLRHPLYCVGFLEFMPFVLSLEVLLAYENVILRIWKLLSYPI